MQSFWEEMKRFTEDAWMRTTVEKEDVYGYQIVPGTKWNRGLNPEQLAQLQRSFGFPLPSDYMAMLGVCNGFDRDSMDMQGGEGPIRFRRSFYKYPDDFSKVAWLLEDTRCHRASVDAALKEEGFDPDKVTGFIPIYSHRALVAFKDQSLSPVLSIWGSDVIVYERDLQSYFQKEFEECF